MIPKAEKRPFRRTHPVFFFFFSFLPPSLKAQDHKEEEASPPPSGKGTHSADTHEFIQPVSKAENPLPSHSSKTEKGSRGKQKKRKRHQSHTSGRVHSIQHTFWPSCGGVFEMTWLWDNKQIIWTFCTRVSVWKEAMQERERQRERDGVMCKRKGDWAEIKSLRPRWCKQETTHLMSAKSPMFLNPAAPWVWRKERATVKL